MVSDRKVNLCWLVYEAIRLEIAEQEAAMQAIETRTNLKRNYEVKVKKIQTNKTEMNDVRTGNFTIKGLFSSSK